MANSFELSKKFWQLGIEMLVYGTIWYFYINY
jgi:hypothetical protein